MLFIILLEAHPIDPGLLNCCYTADNNDWSHRQQPRYQRFVKSSVIIEHKKESFNQGMLIEKTFFLYLYCLALEFSLYMWNSTI